jgi:pimeloyl-ACP methyl ester carboxylesterase
VPYTARNGARRAALLLLPAWYGPHDDPPIPLVISPHGRGGTALGNAAFWGSLPAFGPFAVVSPQGQGRRLTAYSWGWRGQIHDLARMPSTLRRALPWFRFDRVYAIGSSMGGQETLLLDALHPRLLSGAVALDSATNMAARYRAFGSLASGRRLRRLARTEIGGTPAAAPLAYAARSPIAYARRLATNGVPLYIWWSRRDRIVVHQYDESGLLYRTIKRLNPSAPVYQYVGSWDHSAEMRPTTQLPEALVELGLIKPDDGQIDLRRPKVVGKQELVIPVEVPAPMDAGMTGQRVLVARLAAPAAFARSVPWLTAGDSLPTPSRPQDTISATVPLASRMGMSFRPPSALPPTTVTAPSESTSSASVRGSPIRSDRTPITGGPTMNPV